MTTERRKPCQEEIEQDRWALVQGRDGEGAFAPDSVRKDFTTEVAGVDSGEVSASGAFGERHRFPPLMRYQF
jgi:hypothetical protein